MAAGKKTSPEDLQALQEEVARLTKALAGETDRASAAEEALKARAGAQLLGSNVEEIATGKMVKVKRCLNPWERETAAQKFEQRELPTFFYKIDLPPSGGSDISLNGTKFYHGSTYTVDIDLLRDLKEKVYRCWAHENSIMGSNENAYRRPLERTLRGNDRRH